MRLARHFGLVVALLVATTGPAQPDTKTRVNVDLRARRGEIRSVLLRFTSLGSDPAKVMKFLNEDLNRPADAPVTVQNEPATKGSSQRGVVKRISVYLGRYYDHPEIVFFSTPLLMQREVTAQWLFDQHDRLIDIVVEKKNGVY